MTLYPPRQDRWICRRLHVCTLRGKLILTLVGIMAILLVLAAGYYYTLRDSLINEANQKLYAAVSHTAATLDAFVQTNLDSVQAGSQFPALETYLDLPPDQRAGSPEETLVADTLAVLPQPWDQFNLVSYAILDAEGTNIFDTMHANVGQNEADRDYFQQAVKTGLPYAAPVEFSNNIYLHYSCVVRRNAVGPVIGVIRMRFTISTLQNMVSESRDLAGEQSHAILLDENYLRLIDNELPDVLFRSIAPMSSTTIQQLRAADRLPHLPDDELVVALPDFARGIQQAQDQPFFYAHPYKNRDEYQIAAVTMTTMPWTMAFVQPRAVFLAPVEKQTRRAILVAAGLMAGMVALATIVARWLTGPVLRLTAVAEQIAAGDLNVEAEIEADDEIGRLAQTFNQVTAQQRGTLQALEQRVTDLARVNIELEAEMAERQQAQRERDYLAAIIQETQDIAVIKDLDLRIIGGNRALLRIAGAQSLAEVIGKTDAELFNMSPDQEPVRGYMENERLAQTLKRGEVIVTEEALIYPDGEVRIALTRKFPIYDRGEVVATANISSDITGRKRADMALREAHAMLERRVEERTRDLSIANERLRQYTVDLEARNEELDAFAHTVAHDLQGPLGVVIGYAALLADSYKDLPEDQMQMGLSAVEQSGHKMSRIIDELLLLASVRKAEVETFELDMRSIVQEAQKRLVYMIKENNATIVEPDRWPLAVGYGPWIEEVWTNYISNAIKYGGQPPRIELGATVEADKVRFWVRDNGNGLSEDEQARLFTPFTRLDQVRAKGHGLGLSIVRRIMERLGGEVAVESHSGEGSTFSFTLPLAE